MKHIITSLAIFVLAVFVSVFALFPAQQSYALFESAKKQACAGVALNETEVDCDKKAGTKVNTLLSTAINIFSLVIGVIAVIMLIIGGLKYITSQGDSNSIGSAKNTILYAVVGLVITAMAQFIVRFVIGKVK